jgi:tetratricopeptide (TPR) repeat protein
VIDHRYGPAGLLFLAAVALRVAVQSWRVAHDPLFNQTLNDATFYAAWARAIAEGRVYGLAHAPYFMPPLYPQFLALLARMTGGSPWGPTVVQSLLGAVTVVGIYLLGCQVFDRRAGLGAGIVALLFGPLLWFEGWLLPATLNIFLLVVALNLTVFVFQREGRPVWWVLLPGFALGLAAINRPQHLLLLLGIAIWWWWSARGDAAGRWRPAALLLAGAAVAILPVTVRNVAVSGEPVLISANGGLNFYLGNFATARGRFAYPDGFPVNIGAYQDVARRRATAALGDEPSWSAVSRYWFGKGVADLTADPRRALGLWARKLRLAFSWREMENNFYVAWVRRQLGPGRWLLPTVGALWLLALPALLATLAVRPARHGPLLILLVTTLATCVLFWVSTRNRLPLMIPLAVYAGASLTRPRLWRSGKTALALLVVAVAVFWPTGDNEGAPFYANLGRSLARRGQLVAAQDAFRRSLTLNSDNPSALNGLALTYMELGHREEAIARLRNLLQRYPDYEIARRNLEAILSSPPPPPDRKR